jgi:hypothetical protein
MDQAKTTLRRDSESLIDIALACGFSSHAHFSSTFRQIVGVTPSEYRRSHSPNIQKGFPLGSSSSRRSLLCEWWQFGGRLVPGLRRQQLHNRHRVIRRWRLGSDITAGYAGTKNAMQSVDDLFGKYWSVTINNTNGSEVMKKVEKQQLLTAFCNASFRCHGYKTDNGTKRKVRTWKIGGSSSAWRFGVRSCDVKPTNGDRNCRRLQVSLTLAGARSSRCALTSGAQAERQPVRGRNRVEGSKCQFLDARANGSTLYRSFRLPWIAPLYKSHWVIASSFGTSLVLITKLETEPHFEGKSSARSKDV